MKILPKELLILAQKKSVKDLLAIFISTFANQIISLVRGFFVAKVLGPTDFGILKATQLIVMLDKFGSLGLRPAATREVTHFKGEGNLDRANKIRNVAYSGEFLLSALLFLIGVCSSLLFDSTMLIIAVLLASGQLFSSKILGIFNTEAIIEKKIVLYSKVLFWSGLISSLLVIITVPFLRIYAVLGVPILAAVVSCWAYYKAIGAKLKFVISKNELLRLLRIGLPLTVFTLAYGSYRYAERILVGSFLGLEALGFYSLAMMPATQVMSLLPLAIKARAVNVYELLGQKKFHDVHRMVTRETTVLFVLGVISVPILWIAVDVLIPRFLSSYSEAIAIAKILLLAIPFKVISCYSNVVLISSVVNKQVLMGPLQFSVTVIFVGSVLILKYLDLASIVNIAVANVAGYALMHLASVFLYKKYFMDVYLKDSLGWAGIRREK